jgi:hypothetical protein
MYVKQPIFAWRKGNKDLMQSDYGFDAQSIKRSNQRCMDETGFLYLRKK